MNAHAQRLANRSVIAAVALLACACRGVLAPAPDGSPVRRIELNGAELAYREQGQGEAVIFLHSLAADLHVWDELARRFPRNFRFIAYSRRHHTPNRWPDDGDSHTLDQHVEDLAALIPALGLDHAHVVALGLGARVAAHTALRHPNVVRTLVVGDGVLAVPATDEARRVVEAFGAQFETVAERVDVRDERGTAVAVVEWLSREEGGWSALSASRQATYLDNARTLFLVTRDKTLRAPGCEALETLRMPVMILAGERTPPGLRVTNEAAAACISGASYERVPDSGHFWYADNPEAGANHVVRFLAKHRQR